MGVQLGWRPTKSPVVPGSNPPLAGDQQDLALEITGNDPAVADGAEGRVKILEVAGTGPLAGAAEASADRLICTFHGTWHRQGKGRSAALTFEPFVRRGVLVPGTFWQVHGYDPECTPGLGVDGFALTFVSRVFPVNFPFFLDSATEGWRIELQAVAEWDSGGAPARIARSPVQTIRIRRHHTVTSTSKMAGGNMSYTDDLVGNVVLHHKSYLIEGARITHGGTWPSGPINAQYFALAPSTTSAFARYLGLPADRRLRIFLDGGLADELLPASSDSIWSSGRLSGFGGQGLRPSLVTTVRKAILDALIDVFVTDAGFAGAQAAFLDSAPPAHARIVAILKGRGPFTVPFFTFLVERNNSLEDVGRNEEVQMMAPPVALAGFQWRIPSPFPLGTGDKTIRRGIQIRSNYFSEHFCKLVTRPRRPSEPAQTLADIHDAARMQGEKLAETVAHEVGHSLGLMHESAVGPSAANFTETAVGPLRSIMCSLTDAHPYGAGVRFSNQAKVIWRDAFGTTPRLPTDSLRNKNWTPAEIKTLDWPDRIQRMIVRIGEIAISRYALEVNQVSPYKSMPSPQPGTYVP